jgi:hypothetical protein
LTALRFAALRNLVSLSFKRMLLFHDLKKKERLLEDERDGGQRQIVV